MNVVIIYDVSSSHEEVKQKMLQKGYHDNWQANNQIYYLPNTTLWKPNIELNIAMTDIQNVIAEINSNIIQFLLAGTQQVQLKRCITLSANPWMGIQGTKERP